MRSGKHFPNSSNFSPLKVRTIMSTYNKGSHPPLPLSGLGQRKPGCVSTFSKQGSCMDLQKAGVAMLLGSAGLGEVTQQRVETPAGKCSLLVVHPNSADTPVNHLRRGSRAILILAIFPIITICLKIQSQNVLSGLVSSENLPETQIPATHLLLTESGIRRMGPTNWL